MKPYKYRKPRVYQTKSGRYYIYSPTGKKVYVKNNLLSPVASSRASNSNKISVVVKNLLYKRPRRKTIRRKAKIIDNAIKSFASDYSRAIFPTSPAGNNLSNSELENLKKKLSDLSDKADKFKKDASASAEEAAANIRYLQAVLLEKQQRSDEQIAKLIALNEKLQDNNDSDPEIERQLKNAQILAAQSQDEVAELRKIMEEQIARFDEEKKKIMTDANKSVDDANKQLILKEIEIKEKILQNNLKDYKEKTDSLEKARQAKANKKFAKDNSAEKRKATIAKKKLETTTPMKAPYQMETKDEDDDPAGFGSSSFGTGTFSTDLDRIAKMLKIPHYKGCVSSDEIGSITIEPGEKIINFIYNTDVSTGPGIHWVAVRIDDQTIEICNSLGETASEDVKKQLASLFQKINPKIYPLLKENEMIFQNSSSRCGIHALLFLIDRSEGKSFSQATGFVKKSIIRKKERRAKKFAELYF